MPRGTKPQAIHTPSQRPHPTCAAAGTHATTLPRVRALIPTLLLVACAKPASSSVQDTPPWWTPGTVYRANAEPNARGLVDRRGIIHSHSYYSHDACDYAPVNDAGVYDEQ